MNYSVSQILEFSSNVGAVTLAKKLGAERLAYWVKRFGFGSTTGVDYPGESPGFVLPLDQWSGPTIGNEPIGQGISVTPIQMASVYAAVANDGVWIQPHLVDRVGGRAPEKWAQPAPHVPGGRPRGEGDAHRRRLRPGRHGQRGADPGLHGRRQDRHGAGSDRARLLDHRLHRLVRRHGAGVAPALSSSSRSTRPRGSIFGGVVAAPAFAAIAKFDLQYLEVPPDAARNLTNTAG